MLHLNQRKDGEGSLPEVWDQRCDVLYLEVTIRRTKGVGRAVVAGTGGGERQTEADVCLESGAEVLLSITL